jgi:hypothetical protein
MEHIAAIMLLISCPGSGASCHEVGAPQVTYKTVATCHADLRSIVNRRTEGTQLLATCLEIDPAMLFLDAEIVWDITAGGRLIGEVKVTDGQFIALEAS